MKERVSSLLEGMDMFKLPIELNFAGKPHYRTRQGGAISVIVVILSIVIVALHGSSLNESWRSERAAD